MAAAHARRAGPPGPGGRPVLDLCGRPSRRVRGQDRDRDLGVLDDMGADRALKQAGEPAAAAGAEHDQFGVGALVEYFLGRDALGRLDRHRRRAGSPSAASTLSVSA